MTKLAIPQTVGGGTKKVLYTLGTLTRIGIRNSAKALKANNACKACGLGMGGQNGGMVNELGEFPSVCNKSVQAQSTDIQDAIPETLFSKHPIKDFQELSGREIEHLGRLTTPLYKPADSEYYQPISWQEALSKTVSKMRDTDPQKSFFYSSGRSSNESGFILQLLARLYGTNNVNNCSYYCHQATGVALGNTIGSGTATVELEDLTKCDLFFLFGANPASNHPRLIHKLKDLRERGGKVIVINPAKEPGLVRFAVPKSPKSLILGGTEIASEYIQNKIGSDIFVCKGIAKALIEKDFLNKSFIQKHTNGFEGFQEDIDSIAWQDICEKTGVSRESFEKIANMYAVSQNAIFAWGMGITHHTHGVENVEYIANLAFMRGMIGKPYAGLLPLRGHSNVQGIGTIGVKPVLAQDVFHKLQEELGIKLPTSNGLDTLACLEAAHEGNMDFALMLGGNLFSASPDLTWTAEAMDKIDLKVYMTTTLNHGHVNGVENSEAIILPVLARDEEKQATTQESMFNYLRMSDGGIDRFDNIRSETDILTDMGKQLLPDCGIDFLEYKQHSTTRSAIAATIPGMGQLDDIDRTKKEFHVEGRILHEPKFNTQDKRASFITHTFTPDEKDKDYPFTLMSVRSEGQFNSIIYEETDSYRNTDERWSILMSPADMKALNIGRKDLVNITSAHGEMKKVKVFPFDLPEKNIMAYYPEANVLIGRERDPRSKTPAFKAISVSIDITL